MATTRLMTAVLLVQCAYGFQYFQLRIPNGANVSHPCNETGIWQGVGHLRASGGGPRNPFGLDFYRLGTKWSEGLCQLDSDGDGRSNGDELGDPYCNWTPGTTPNRTYQISHPGVCEPVGDPQCMNKNKDVHCGSGEFVCDPIHEEGVFNITLRLPRVQVPSSRYTYMCYTFPLDMLDKNTDYHLIATKPYIDNPTTLHHIQLNGCGPLAQPLEKPEVCNMAASTCQNYLSIWTLGLNGECLPVEAGFKVNRDNMPWLTMQIHYSNPEMRGDYEDSSGMVLYLTKNLREFNAGYWNTGEIHLNIPPHTPFHETRSLCTADCTRTQMPGPVHIMTVRNHMHYLGIHGNIEHLRNGYKIKDLSPDDVYSYDYPYVHTYDPPHMMLPGDELLTTCVYSSADRKVTTLFGESAEDEMCLGIITFYPAENIQHDSCYTWKDFDICYVKNASIHGCSYNMIFNPYDEVRKGLVSKVLDNCNFYGECRRECPAAIAEVRKHPCFNDLTGPYMMDLLRALNPNVDMVKFLAAMQSCECPMHGPKTTTEGFPWTSSAQTSLPALTTVLFPFLAMILS